MNGLGSVGAALLEVALLLAIPIAIAELGWVGLRRLAPEGFFKIPALTGSAKILGIATGILLLSSRYDRHYFDLHDLFVPESPWNLSLREFLTERVNPLDYVAALVTHLAADPMSKPLMIALALIGFLLVVVIAAPFAVWPAPLAARGLACGLLMALIVAYLTLYSISVLMWTLFLLNFWTFAVLIVVFQYYRNRT